MSAKKKVRVLEVYQSPMNAKRWVLILSCHHEKWITATRKPAGKMQECPICECEKQKSMRVI